MAIRPYNKWTKVKVNETNLMFQTILPKSNKTIDDWKVIFDLHAYIFTNTNITDYTNNKLRLIVYENLQHFYRQPEWKTLKENKL